MSALQQKLESGGFITTAEVCPPKGCTCDDFLKKAGIVAKVTDAINVTDNQGANLRMSPVAAAAILARAGMEPILQITCRDRNRLALQSELLGAAALGVTNILALTGDHISFGDHRAAKPVFDLDSVQLLQMIGALNGGHDLSGSPITGAPSFFCGAAAAPEAEPFELAVIKLRKKAIAGARFLQTQAIFDETPLKRLTATMRPLGVKVVAGILLVKSAKMARFVNDRVPGLHIPLEVVNQLEQARDPLALGVEIARQLVSRFQPHCDGVHIMAMGKEELVPDIVSALDRLS